MKRAVFQLSMLFLPFILFFTQCKSDTSESYDFQFQFLSEEYAPFNYSDSGKVTGLSANLLEEICLQLRIPFEVKMADWEHVYQQATENPNTVLFSTALNQNRKDLFKWAGPIAFMEIYFYALSENRIRISSLEEAKKIEKIGVLKSYAQEQYLLKQGFENLVYCTDHHDAMDKLLKGEIDLYPMDRWAKEKTLGDMGHSQFKLKEVLPLNTEMLYFAFNKNIPDEVVADFQNEIDRLKQNGFLKKLYQDYLGSSDFPGSLIVYTEDYPPLTFCNTFGEISGYGSDIVKEIMKRNRIFEKIRVSTWSNAYEMALSIPNLCLFTMDKTPAREPLFQWVGPIGTNTTYIYTRKGSGIEIHNLEEAKKISSIGTVSSWFSDQYLREQGFSNLVSDPNPVVLTQKLIKGEIDAFVCSEVTFPDIVYEAGFQYLDVSPAFALMSSDFYISFSKSTPPSTVNQWQSTLAGMKSDGTIDAIRKKWLPE